MDDEKKLPKEERDKIINEILAGQYPEEEFAVIGENRGQLFVRIPKFVEKRVGFKKGQKVRFLVRVVEGKNKLDMEVV